MYNKGSHYPGPTISKRVLLLSLLSIKNVSWKEEMDNFVLISWIFQISMWYQCNMSWGSELELDRNDVHYKCTYSQENIEAY